MSSRNLLVYLDRSSSSERRLPYACALAAHLGWAVTGLFAHDASEADRISTMTAAGEADTRELRHSLRQARSKSNKAAAHLKARFDEYARHHGLQSEWLEEDATEATVENNASRADVVVLGPYTDDSEGFEGPRPEMVALRSGRPILLVPDNAVLMTAARRPLVAWNGQRESVRAIYDAMPILELADTVSVVEVLQEGKGAKHVSARDMAAYLTARRVTATPETRFKGTGRVADILVSEALSQNCDLIVMGAYGSSPTREALLGGATRDMLRMLTVPLLMSH